MVNKKATSRFCFDIRNGVLSKSKRSQHEIAGFVLIVVIVCIIGVIFLSFAIGGKSEKRTSAEISDFLQSSIYYTTECADGHIPDYYNLQDLIKTCFNGGRCLDERDSCQVLNETIKEILDSGFQTGNGKNKAYKLNIYYKDLIIEGKEAILELGEGVFEECNSEVGASHSIYRDNGNINVELEVCRN